MILVDGYVPPPLAQRVLLGDPYPVPHGTLNVTWQGAKPSPSVIGTLAVSWGAGLDMEVYPRGIGSKVTFGTAGAIKQQFVAAASVMAPGVPAPRSVLHPGDYVGAQHRLNVSWQGAEPYGAPFGSIIGTWSHNRYVAPLGIGIHEVPNPLVIQQQLVKGAGGIFTFASGSKHYTLLDWQYAPPQWRLDATWVGKDEYLPAKGTLSAAWALPQEAKQVSLTGWDSAAFGQVSLPVVKPAGWVSAAVPAPNVRNTAVPIRPGGFNAQAFGTLRIWNWRQYVPMNSFASERFGAAYVIGGLKEIKPAGLAPPALGTVKVVNTRADQHARPEAIKPIDVPRPAVSPQILRPIGMLGTVVGSHLVQFPPHPVGWLSSAMGYPVVDFKTKLVRPAGIDAYSTGYPRVRDRAQKVWPISAPVSAVFGDVAIRLRTFKINVPGFDAHEPSPWALLANVRRLLGPLAIAAPGMGLAAIRNKSPNITPKAFDASLFGAHDIGGPLKRISPKGIPSPFEAIPSPVLWRTPSFAPSGVAAPPVPEPTVWLRRRAFDIGGFETLRVGQPGVDFRWRKVPLEGFGIAAGTYGAPRVEHTLRGIGPAGWSREAFGDAWLSFRRRYIEPRGIDFVEMSRQRVGGTQHVGPEGFEATRWLTRIIPEAQEIFPKTFGAAYGLATVGLYRRHLRPEGMTTEVDSKDRWGLPRVWHLRQYIVQFEDQQGGLAPPKWGGWTAIENRNKTMRGIGTNTALYGRPVVWNKARLLEPSGIAAPALPEYQKTGSVTHRIRPLFLDGLEPPLIPRWAVVWNKAFPLRPRGLVATSFGAAQVVNTRRYRNAQGFDSQSMGFPMVAFRIRTLTFESRYSIGPPRIDLPSLRLHTRYVEVPGMDGAVRGQSKLGLPIVVSHRNMVTTRWTHRDFVGMPELRNRTPELRVRGGTMDEWGSALVRLQWRAVAADGANTALFGKARVADRQQQVIVPGFNMMRIGDKLTVRKYGIDPVTTQYIDLRKFVTNSNGQQELSDGYGIPIPPEQVAAPNLLKGYINLDRPNNYGIGPGFVGQPVVTANTIRVEPGYWDLLVGEPFVSLKDRTIQVPTMGQLVVDGQGPNGMESWGLPRITPHTIYAVMEAPAQAMRNHLTSQGMLRPVNDGARLGMPNVSQQRGNILYPMGFHNSSISTAYGRPNVFNRLQQISVTGWSSMRLGFIVLPHTITVEQDQPFEGSGFGTAQVTRPPYVGPQTLKPVGLAAAGYGVTEVSHRHRTVSPQGYLAERMGASDHLGNNMPTGLYVSPPNLHPQVGFDALGIGKAWVSHKVREIQVKGWDSFICDYDPRNFKHRMRVRRLGEESIGWQLTKPAAFVDTRVGTPNVRPGVHYIRPDGNSDQFRKGVHI
ncbi:hypothetical protein A4F85_04610 [Delftia sp. GW456-R20]|uniref:hypothetical protein n=1 Tax=Delftia sp. GW456-R20 TaxID=1827145 RepID=UPI0007AE4272|nr:hypothetical protein [Delftia sp. GW456-R20]KZK32003.1 hypothetical protein A4F85_04610 [Delftia sp. GW456-R20]